MPTAARIRWAKFRIVVVSLVAATILVILFYLFTGGTLFQQKATLYLYVPDATGLARGSPVRIDGVTVGKVSSVELSGSNQPLRVVQVAMRIGRERLANVPVDSTADLGTDTLVGDKFVGIKSGKATNYLVPGAEVALQAQTSTLDLKEFAKSLRTVDDTLRDIQNGTSPLGQFVLGDQMYQDLLRRVAQIQAGLQGIENTDHQIGAMLYTDKTLRDIEAPVLALDKTLQEIQSGQGPMGALLRDSQQYDSLRQTFVNLGQSVRQFQSSDMVQSDALYRQWNRSLAGLIQQVDQMNANPLFSSSSAYDNINGMAAEMEKTLREFREDPRKFLRLKVF